MLQHALDPIGLPSLIDPATLDGPQVHLEYPRKFDQLLRASRFKVVYGGRGSGKTWTIARLMIAKALNRKHRILCCREYQNSIRDSVHRTLVDQIDALQMRQFFDITRDGIYCTKTGTEFIFRGLHNAIGEIRSTEGITICWVEEAAIVTEESWIYLIPTVRAPDSEIWISFNPESEDDPVYRRFVLHPPRNCITLKVGWQDNKWFPPVLEEQRLSDLEANPDYYDWIWEGHTRKVTNAAVFKGNFVVSDFPDVQKGPRGWFLEIADEIYEVERLYYGADWGFANDPTCLIRCFITDRGERGKETLWIDYEAYGKHVELDDLPALFDGGVAQKTGANYPGVPGAKEWVIRADSSQPAFISYLSRHGFRMQAAEKWAGSVEDGIGRIKSFRKIMIHSRCVNLAQEARLYSYKVDKSGEVIPKLVEDEHNHGIDAIRYALDSVIKGKGGQLDLWRKLAGSQYGMIRKR